MSFALDSISEASSAYDIRAIPTMFIIDQKGNIHEKHIGGDPSIEKKLLKTIDKLLGS